MDDDGLEFRSVSSRLCVLLYVYEELRFFSLVISGVRCDDETLRLDGERRVLRLFFENFCCWRPRKHWLSAQMSCVRRGRRSNVRRVRRVVYCSVGGLPLSHPFSIFLSIVCLHCFMPPPRAYDLPLRCSLQLWTYNKNALKSQWETSSKTITKTSTVTEKSNQIKKSFVFVDFFWLRIFKFHKTTFPFATHTFLSTHIHTHCFALSRTLHFSKFSLRILQKRSKNHFFCKHSSVQRQKGLKSIPRDYEEYVGGKQKTYFSKITGVS